MKDEKSRVTSEKNVKAKQVVEKFVCLIKSLSIKNLAQARKPGKWTTTSWWRGTEARKREIQSVELDRTDTYALNSILFQGDVSLFSLKLYSIPEAFKVFLSHFIIMFAVLTASHLPSPSKSMQWCKLMENSINLNNWTSREDDGIFLVFLNERQGKCCDERNTH